LEIRVLLLLVARLLDGFPCREFGFLYLLLHLLDLPHLLDLEEAKLFGL
jgi:hypothetical protein